jgi:hypothetical protein
VKLYSKNKFEKLVHLICFIIRKYHDARASECKIWEILSYFKNDKHGNGAEHCGYDKSNVVGICGNENQGEKVLALITKLNKYNTLLSKKNSHYKFLSENS